MSNEKVVFQQLLAGGEMGNRVIQKADGRLIAQVRRSSDNLYIRASTKQAAALFRDALAISLVRRGDQVVAWDRSINTFRLCTSLGRDDNDSAHVVVYDDVVRISFQTQFILTPEMAHRDRVWDMPKGLQVEAAINGQWFQATYIRYDEETNRHLVRVAGQKQPQWATFIND